MWLCKIKMKINSILFYFSTFKYRCGYWPHKPRITWVLVIDNVVNAGNHELKQKETRQVERKKASDTVMVHHKIAD